MAVCFVWLNATVGLGRDMAGQEEGQMVSSRHRCMPGVTEAAPEQHDLHQGGREAPDVCGQRYTFASGPWAAAGAVWFCLHACEPNGVISAAVQVLATIDGTPAMQAPGPNTLITPQGQTIQLPVGYTNQEVKESMQSHFD
jgi:hypothetical protein